MGSDSAFGEPFYKTVEMFEKVCCEGAEWTVACVHGHKHAGQMMYSGYVTLTNGHETKFVHKDALYPIDKQEFEEFLEHEFKDCYPEE